MRQTSHESTSVIDFMIVSDSSMFTYSNQVFCNSVSHHSLIYARLDVSKNRFNEFAEFLDYRNTNWNGLL